MTRSTQLASAALIMLIAGPGFAQGKPAPKRGPASTPTVAASAASPKAVTPSLAPNLTDAQIMAGIKQPTEGHYEIQRAVLNDLMKALPRQARVVPQFVNGAPQGFRFLAIRPNSLYHRIGVQAGDVLKGINGHTITGPADALETYSKIKTSNNFSVMLVREGRAITQDYTIK